MKKCNQAMLSTVPPDELTQDIVRELINYDPRSGIVRWKKRAIHWFNPDGWKGVLRNCNSWNGKFAGKIAGSLRPSVDGLRTYYYTTLLGYSYPMHQLAFFYMTGRWPLEVDHKDGDGSNNKWTNLHEVTRSQNQQNRRRQRSYNGRPLSLPLGVKAQTRGGRFNARIGYRGKVLDLGTYDTVEQALLARKQAEHRLGFSARHGMS